MEILIDEILYQNKGSNYSQIGSTGIAVVEGNSGDLGGRTPAQIPTYSLVPRKLPFWRVANIAGEPATEDPFVYLIAKSNATEFVGDWRAKQSLPAAREALNEYLISLR
jgi:hypothetical protein